MLSIERENDGAVTVLRLDGDLDESSINEVRLLLSACMKERSVLMVLNLEKLQFMSRLAVAMLLQKDCEFRGRCGELRLACPSVYVRRLLQMCGVGTSFYLHSTEASAVQACQRAA